MKKFAAEGANFFHLRVDYISKSYLFHRSKQEFKQVYKTLLSEKEQGVFIRINTVIFLQLLMGLPLKNNKCLRSSLTTVCVVFVSRYYNIYSRTSVARTLMAPMPRLFGTRS